MKIDVDGYFFFEDIDGDQFLMIAEEDYDIVFDYIKEKGIKNIMLSINGGCSGDDLDFLAYDYKFEKISVFFKEKVDLSKLYHQTELKKLVLSDVDFNIDYNRFPHLESLILIGQKGEIRPFNKGNKLKYFKVNQLSNKDLTFLRHCKNLEKLIIHNSGRLTSLSGLENTSNSLIQIEINLCSKLYALWEIDSARELKRFFIEKCPSLHDVAVLQKAKALELVYIVECKEINSLVFLDDLPALKEVILYRTKILDGYIPKLVME
jgi:hypothetical protein